MIELVVENKDGDRGYLDVDQDVVIALTKQFLSLTDIDKRTGDYSKSFPLPKTPRNVQYFGSWGDPSVIGGNWDTRFEAPCWLLEDTNIITEGSLRMENSNPDLDKYQVSISGRSFSLKELIGELLLSDVDMSDWEFRLSDIDNSWDGTEWGGDQIFPTFDYGQGLGQYVKEGDPAVLTLQDIKTAATPYRAYDSRPAVRLNEFLRRIFNEQDLVIGGSWFSEPESEQIYVMNTSTVNPYEPKASPVYCELAFDNIMVVDTWFNLYFNANPSHPNWDDVNYEYICTIDGRYFWDIRVDPTAGTPAGLTLEIGFQINGGTVSVFSSNDWDQAVAFSNLSTSLYAGDRMKVVYRIFPTPVTTLGFIFQASGNTTLELGNMIPGFSLENDPSAFWTPYRQIDFIRAITQIFNLIIWFPDNNSVRFDTWNYYMATYGEKKDWTDKLDIDSVRVRPINGELRNPINISLSEATDIINTDYQVSAGRQYGSYLEDTRIPFTQKEASDIDMFCPCPTQDIISTAGAANFPEFIIHKYYNDIDNIAFKTSGLQLCYYNGPRTVPAFRYKVSPTGATGTSTIMPYFSVFRLYAADAWLVKPDTLDLNFTWWTPPTSTNIVLDLSQEGVYNRYFREMLRERYDEANKLIDCKLVLTSRDIANFSFADTILVTINGTPVGLKILEIKDYSPSRTKSTQVKAMLTFIR